MFPILFTIGPFVISTVGVFIALGFLSAVFVSWRLAKVYDIKEEKILDMALSTFGGGLVVARMVAVALNFNSYASLEKIIYLHKYPGLSFWGGFFGAALSLWLFSKFAKLPLWQVADFAAVGVLTGLVIGNFGCFFGGCGFGAVSDLPIALPVVGLIGKRLPISLIEGIILLFVTLRLYKQVIKFHFAGKIVAKFLIILGILKFISEFYRGNTSLIFPNAWVSFGHVTALITFGLGVAVFYSRSKRNIFTDAENLLDLFSEAKKRQLVLSSWKKSWYNHKTAWRLNFNKSLLSIKSLPKRLRRKLNVKPTPTDIR